MKKRFIGAFLVAVLLVLSFPSGAAASHSFTHIIETLRNALIEVHRTFSLPAAPSGKFRMGDRVVVQSSHSARSDPLFSSWIVVGGAPVGARGTVIGSPKTISGTTWWNVIYDTGTFGWSLETNLAKGSTATPLPAEQPAILSSLNVNISVARVDNFNAYVSLKFTTADQDTLKQIVRNALSVFSSQYSTIDTSLIIFEETEYLEVRAKDPFPLKIDEDNKVLAYVSRDNNIFMNGSVLLRGKSVIDPTGYFASGEPTGVIIHELAHIAIRKCACENAWTWLQSQDVFDGIVSQYAKDRWLLAEVFPETVVGYYVSGGRPEYYFNNERNREALRRKFKFLEDLNIVRGRLQKTLSPGPRIWLGSRKASPATIDFTAHLVGLPSCGAELIWDFGDGNRQSLSDACSGGVATILPLRTLTRTHSYIPGDTTIIASLSVGATRGEIAVVTSAATQVPP